MRKKKMIVFLREIRLLVLAFLIGLGSFSQVSAADQPEKGFLSKKTLFPATTGQNMGLQSDNTLGDNASASGQGLFRSTNYNDGFGDEELGVVTPVNDGIFIISLLVVFYFLLYKIERKTKNRNEYEK